MKSAGCQCCPWFYSLALLWSPALFPCPVIHLCVIFIWWELSVPRDNCSCAYETIWCPMVAFPLWLNSKLLSARNGFSWHMKGENGDRMYLMVSIVTEFVSAWTGVKANYEEHFSKTLWYCRGECRPQSQWFWNQVLGNVIPAFITMRTSLVCSTSTSLLWKSIQLHPSHRSNGRNKPKNPGRHFAWPQANNTSHHKSLLPLPVWQEMLPRSHLWFLVLFLSR